MKKAFIKITAVTGLMFVSFEAIATKPCPSNSYFSNPSKTNKSWVESSSWAAQVNVTKIINKWVPYPNCSNKNKSKCAKQNIGTFDAKITKVLKGKIKTGNFNFKAAYCAKEIPSTKGTYVFYGSNTSAYEGHYKNSSK